MTLPKTFLDRHVVGFRVLLGNGRWAPLDFYGDVYECSRERIPTLLPGLGYKAEHITGPNFWVPLPPVLARLAGQCIRDMADRALLPLAVDTGHREVTLRYCLK